MISISKLQATSEKSVLTIHSLETKSKSMWVGPRVKKFPGYTEPPKRISEHRRKVEDLPSKLDRVGH